MGYVEGEESNIRTYYESEDYESKKMDAAISELKEVLGMKKNEKITCIDFYHKQDGTVKISVQGRRKNIFKWLV